MGEETPRRIINSAKSQTLEVTVRIGRIGITESLISEISDQLSRKNLVKVKANKGITSDRQQRRMLFSEIAKLTSASVVFQRGTLQYFGLASK